MDRIEPSQAVETGGRPEPRHWLTSPSAAILGTRGAATMLGITPSAIRKLIQRERFPLPDVILDGRRAWRRETIERYAREARRRRGRPAKNLAQPAHHARQDLLGQSG
jgi:predicted DNA-binding transcriptional regulator AlpA